MEKIDQQLRTLFAFALALSICFPLGVLGIIFGAVNWIVPLLVAGIILTVAGFYVMPILWVKYGEKRGDRTLLCAIQYDHIYTVRDLSIQTGYPEENVRMRIQRMILARQLTGYLFRNDVLELNINRRQTKESAQSSRRQRTCPGCGAQMFFDGLHFRCDYCGRVAEDK